VAPLPFKDLTGSNLL